MGLQRILGVLFWYVVFNVPTCGYEVGMGGIGSSLTHRIKKASL